MRVTGIVEIITFEDGSCVRIVTDGEEVTSVTGMDYSCQPANVHIHPADDRFHDFMMKRVPEVLQNLSFGLKMETECMVCGKMRDADVQCWWCGSQ